MTALKRLGEQIHLSCCTPLPNKIEKGRLRLAETAFDLGWS
ncbi:hypothetical protein [Micromonospora sp. IBHARD004]